MFPVIYDFGVVDLFGFQFRLAIYSFGLMLVAAFYTCYFLLDKDLRELGYDEKKYRRETKRTLLPQPLTYSSRKDWIRIIS